MIVLTAKDLTAEDRRLLNGDVQSVLQKGALSRDELLREIHELDAHQRRTAGGRGVTMAEDPAGRRQRDEPRHAVPAPRSGKGYEVAMAVDGEQGVEMALNGKCRISS